MAIRSIQLANCGCEVINTKKFASKHTCNGCGNLFCGIHIYSYVDESNSAITRNSKLYCENCYKNKYK